MKVVIWKPAVAVFWNKTQDISGTTRDIKNLKIGFCRGDFILFDDMFEYTVLGYLNSCFQTLLHLFWTFFSGFQNGGAAAPQLYLQRFCCMWRSYMCEANIYVYGNFMGTCMGRQFRQRSSIAGASGAHLPPPSPTYLPLYPFPFLTKLENTSFICGKMFSTRSANF